MDEEDHEKERWLVVVYDQNGMAYVHIVFHIVRLKDSL